jgi:hypothetical protein
MRWLPFLIGWLVGSFFGLQAIMAMLRGLGGNKQQAAS